MFLRPLASETCALVFFSRRTDMPYRFHSSLAQLNFTSSSVYEVSALQVVSALCVSGRASLGVVLTHTWPSLSHEPWVLWYMPVGQLQALGAVVGAVLYTGISKLRKHNCCV